MVLGAPSALLTRNETKRKGDLGVRRNTSGGTFLLLHFVLWDVSVVSLCTCSGASDDDQLGLGGSEGKEGLGPPTGGYETNTG